MNIYIILFLFLFLFLQKVTSIFKKKEIKEEKYIKNTFLDFKHNLNKLINRWNSNNPKANINNNNNINIKDNAFNKFISISKKNKDKNPFISSEEIRQLLNIQKRENEILNNICSELK